jgi:hypothetical protein
MKKLSYILLFILFFYVGLILFLPKTALYYQVEHLLKPHGIVLDDELFDENMVSLDVENITVLYKSMEIARIDQVTLTPLLLNNSVVLEKVVFDQALKLPEVDRVTLNYSPFSHEVVDVVSSGAFGDLNGTIHLQERKVRLEIRSTLNFSFKGLQKRQGGYYYEQTF